MYFNALVYVHVRVCAYVRFQVCEEANAQKIY